MTAGPHILQIVSAISRESNGAGATVRRLAASVAEQGATCDILSTGQSPGNDVRAFPIDAVTIPALGNLNFSRALARALERAASAASVIHAHGLWRMPNIYPARAAAKCGTPLIVSPHGMLAPAAMQFSRLQKRVFWALAQHKALKAATLFHATSAEEVADIRAAGLTQPIALIPLGIDIPPADVAPQTGGPPTILYLGRLHPKKGVDRLIDAWAKVEADFPEWRLRIVGPSEVGYADQLKARAEGLQHVQFENAIPASATTAAFCSAEAFVLPTLNENFGLVVAESLAAGTPVICTNGAPWQGLETERCGWWIDQGVAPLETALRQAMTATPQTRAEMGARGRAWMARDFSWQQAAQQMLEIYRWTAGEGAPPPCLSLT